MLFKQSNQDSIERPSSDPSRSENTSWTQRTEKVDRLSWDEGEKPDKDDEELQFLTAQLFYNTETDKRKEEERKRRQKEREEEERYYAEETRKAQERRLQQRQRREIREKEHRQVKEAYVDLHVREPLRTRVQTTTC